jgi:hypothetical protein
MQFAFSFTPSRRACSVERAAVFAVTALQCFRKRHLAPRIYAGSRLPHSMRGSCSDGCATSYASSADVVGGAFHRASPNHIRLAAAGHYHDSRSVRIISIVTMSD